MLPLRSLRYRRRGAGMREERAADIKRQANHAANWDNLKRKADQCNLDWPQPKNARLSR